MSAAAGRVEDITPFDIERFLALMEHPEVKAAIFKLIDEREREKFRPLDQRERENADR